MLAAQDRVEAATVELQNCRARHKDLSLELESLQNKVQRSENRLYSGKVTNPKELTDLQSEISSLGRRRESLEDELLEVMILIEDNEEELSSASESLAEIETNWNQTLAGLQQQQNELALRLQTLTGLRQKQLPLIPPKALAEYERIGKRHGGLAVTLLRGNICQGCRLNISASSVKAVTEGRLVYCDNCGRILTQSW